MTTESKRGAERLHPPLDENQLAAMPWQDFEVFAVRVVEAVYGGYKLSFNHTNFSHDRGRDGEAEFLLGIDLERDFQIVVRLWVEVKKRSTENIGKKDLSSHLVDATLQSATKIIFVTNRDFSEHLDDWLSEFGRRTGVQYQLINGKKLLDIYNQFVRRTQTLSPCDNEGITSDRPGTSNEEVSELHVDCWFSLNPSDARPNSLREGIVHARPDRPIYLIVEIGVGRTIRPFPGRLEVHLPNSNAATIYPYSPPSRRGSLFSPGDIVYKVFVIWPQKRGRWAQDDFVIDIVTDVRHEAAVAFRNTCEVQAFELREARIRTQQKARGRLEELLLQWERVRGFSAAALVAPPGVGKSRVLARTREYCSRRGLSEFYVDCEAIRTDLDFLGALVRELLPLPRTFFDRDLQEAVEAWCVDVGIEEESARQLAEDICTKSSTGSMLPPAARVEALLAVLTFSTGRRPLVLLIEDLHKAAPSLINLLSNLASQQTTLGTLGLFMLAATRPFPNTSVESGTAWSSEIHKLVDREGCELLELRRPTLQESRQLLSLTIPSLASHHQRSILRQAGTTPFHIREAVLYLLAKRVLTPAPEFTDDALQLADPRGLSKLLTAEKLRRATELRLQIIVNQHPEGLRDLLLAGATYGRSFPLGSTLKAIGIEDSRNLDEMLEVCSQWSILTLIPSNVDHLEFDHDLVRLSVLQSSPLRRRRKLAALILRAVDESVPTGVRCSLAFQAGISDECLAATRQGAVEARREGRFADVVELNQLAIRILDSDLAAEAYALDDLDDGAPFFDEAVHSSPPCPIENWDRERIQEAVLALLLDSLNCLNSVGSGTGNLSERFLSEARMLAEKLGRIGDTARLLDLEGRMWFGREDFTKAEALHDMAEELLVRQGEDFRQQRASNLVRLAIVLRRQGQIDESLSTLRKALSCRTPGNWILLSKVRSNLGAAYLRSDWSKARHHWAKQVQLAERRHLPSRVVHGLASLSFLDLFEGYPEEAFQKIATALEMAEDLRMDNQIVRLTLNLSVYYLLTGQARAAVETLFKAEEAALRHNIIRRLWRVMANLATAHEVMGDLGNAYTRDLQTLRLLTKSANMPRPGRRILPFVNILLRAREHRKMWAGLLDGGWAKESSEAQRFAQAVLSGEEAELPQLLGRYCVSLPPGRRFLLTE